MFNPFGLARAIIPEMYERVVKKVIEKSKKENIDINEMDDIEISVHENDDIEITAVEMDEVGTSTPNIDELGTITENVDRMSRKDLFVIEWKPSPGFPGFSKYKTPDKKANINDVTSEHSTADNTPTRKNKMRKKRSKTKKNNKKNCGKPI